MAVQIFKSSSSGIRKDLSGLSSLRGRSLPRLEPSPSRYPLDRDVRVRQHAAHNPFIAPNRNGILLRTMGSTLRCCHYPPIRPIGNRQLRQRDQQIVRLHQNLGAVGRVVQRHAVVADNQIRIPPRFHVLNMLVFRGIRGRNRLQNGLRVLWRRSCLLRTCDQSETRYECSFPMSTPREQITSPPPAHRSSLPTPRRQSTQSRSSPEKNSAGRLPVDRACSAPAQ